MPLKTIEATVGNLGYALKQARELEAAGALPENGKIPLMTAQQAQEIISQHETNPNKPDCSRQGLLKAIDRRAAQDLHLEEKAKVAACRAMKGRGYVGADIVMAALSPETFIEDVAQDLIDTVLPAVSKASSKISIYFGLLQDVERVFLGAHEVLWDHKRACSHYLAGTELPKEMSKTEIAKVTYGPSPTPVPPDTSDLSMDFTPLIQGNRRMTPWRRDRDVSKEPEERAPLKDSAPGLTHVNPNKALQPSSSREAIPEKSETKVESPLAGKVTVNPNIGNVKNSSVSFEQPMTPSTAVVGSLIPGKIQQSTVGISSALNALEGTQQKLGMQISPFRPKNTALSAQCLTEKGGFGVNMPVLKPLDLTMNFACKVPGKVDLSGRICPKKPLESEIDARVPFNVCGVPLVMGCRMKLKRPENAHLTVGISTVPFVSKAVGKFLPSNIQILSLSKTSAKKFAHKTKKVFGKVFSSHKRKGAEIVYVPWCPTHEATQLTVELHILASRMGYIPPDVDPELFSQALVGDWQERRPHGTFHTFLLEVKDLMAGGKFCLIPTLCPRSLSSVPADKAKIVDALADAMTEIVEFTRQFVASEDQIAEELALTTRAMNSRHKEPDIGQFAHIHNPDERLIAEMNCLLDSV